MSMVEIVEVSAESRDSFEDAIRKGIASASNSTPANRIKGVWVSRQQMHMERGRVAGYRVAVRVAFTADG